MKTILPFFLLLSSSCGFWIYNYRGILVTEFNIRKPKGDSLKKEEVVRFIYDLAESEHFYKRWIGPNYDSLYLYGPDYHHFRFSIRDRDTAVSIYLRYFAFNGWRKKPPHKKFVDQMTDSMKYRFHATEVIWKNINNEKRKE